MAKRLDLKDVNIFYGKFHAVSDVTLSVLPATSRRSSARPAAVSPPCSAPSTACTR